MKIVDTPEKLEDLGHALADAKVISFDTETTSTDEMQADLVGISLAVKEDQGSTSPLVTSPGPTFRSSR